MISIFKYEKIFIILNIASTLNIEDELYCHIYIYFFLKCFIVPRFVLFTGKTGITVRAMI